MSARQDEIPIYYAHEVVYREVKVGGVAVTVTPLVNTIAFAVFLFLLTEHGPTDRAQTGFALALLYCIDFALIVSTLAASVQVHKQDYEVLTVPVHSLFVDSALVFGISTIIALGAVVGYVYFASHGLISPIRL